MILKSQVEEMARHFGHSLQRGTEFTRHAEVVVLAYQVSLVSVASTNEACPLFQGGVIFGDSELLPV